jgi:hypothetical protein
LSQTDTFKVIAAHKVVGGKVKPRPLIGYVRDNLRQSSLFVTIAYVLVGFHVTVQQLYKH